MADSVTNGLKDVVCSYELKFCGTKTLSASTQDNQSEAASCVTNPSVKMADHPFISRNSKQNSNGSPAHDNVIPPPLEFAEGTTPIKIKRRRKRRRHRENSFQNSNDTPKRQKVANPKRFCVHCGNGYSNTYNMNRHIKSAHKWLVQYFNTFNKNNIKTTHKETLEDENASPKTKTKKNTEKTNDSPTNGSPEHDNIIPPPLEYADDINCVTTPIKDDADENNFQFSEKVRTDTTTRALRQVRITELKLMPVEGKQNKSFVRR